MHQSLTTTINQGLILVLLFNVISLKSQNSFYSEGLLIKNNRDTIRGYIKEENERKLSIEIYFKKTKDSSESEIYRAGEILGYQFMEDNRKFRTISITSRKDSVIKESKRFGKILLEGYCDLYKVMLFPEEYEKVFISDQYIYVVNRGKEWLRLEQTEHQVEVTDYVIRKKYLGMLKYLSQDCAKESLNNEEPNFTDREIVSYIKKYNSCKSPEEEQIEHFPIDKTQIKHYVSLAYLKPLNQGALIRQGDQFTSGNFYGMGYTINVYQPSKYKEISVNIGFTYYEGVLRGDSGTERRSAYDLFMSLNYLLSRGNRRPFLTCGFRIFNFRLLYGGGIDIGNIRVYANLEAESILNPIKHLDYGEIGVALSLNGNKD